METADKNIEAPQKKKLTTHVGRFQKVARNKHVKGYSATDLAAILGANGDEQVLALTHLQGQIFFTNSREACWPIASCYMTAGYVKARPIS